MNRLTLSLLTIVGLLAAGEARAFGLPKAELPKPEIAKPEIAKPEVPGTDASGGATTQDVDAFIASSIASEVMVRKSSVALGQAVLAKEVLDKLEERRLAAEKMADGKEKDAALRKVDADRNAELAKVDYQKVSKDDAAKWDEKKKESVRAALFNLALGGLIDTELVAAGRKLASGTPSPAVATRMPLVKETVSALGGQIDGLAKVTKAAQVLGTTVKLEKLPKSAAEKPVAFD